MGGYGDSKLFNVAVIYDEFGSTIFAYKIAIIDKERDYERKIRKQGVSNYSGIQR